MSRISDALDAVSEAHDEGTLHRGAARIIAIDPGPQTCGLVLYDASRRVVLEAHKAIPTDDALRRVSEAATKGHADVVACERMQSYGIAGGSLLRTAEVYGRFCERAYFGGLRFVGLYRRDVLRELDLLGARGNRDSAVRSRMIEMHGGTQQVAVGRKSDPGPLYGVSSHAWQALGVAVALASRDGFM